MSTSREPELESTPESGPAQTRQQVTRLLQRWMDGDQEALAEMTPLVYDELRVLARSHMRRERSGHVLQTTALVNEAYLAMVGLQVDWRSRAHFYSVVSQMMRRVLVNLARRRDAAKRGGEASLLSLDESLVGSGPRLDVIALDLALEKMAAIDERKVKVVEMRCFGGMTIDEVSEVLEVSPATVERDLSFARAWLARHLGPPS